MAGYKLFMRPDQKRKKDGTCPVYIQITHRQRRKRLPTGENIKPADIDKRQKLFRLKGQLGYAHIFNQRFDEIETKMEEILRKFRYSNKPYTVDNLAQEFILWFRPGAFFDTEDWEPMFDLYIEERKKTDALNTIRGKRVAKQLLIEYLGGREIAFGDFTVEFMNDLVDWCMDLKTLEPSYIKKKLEVFRQFFQYSNFLGKAIPDEVCKFKPARKLAIKQNDVVFLTADEFNSLAGFKGSEANEKIRDAFLIMCLTGLRHSDANLGVSDIQEGRIVKRMKKTDKNAIIPMTGLLTALLEKYNNAPPYYSNPVLNREIKNVAELAGLDRLVKIIKYPGGVKTEEILPIYKIISTKFGRRSLVSNLLSKGIPEHVVSIITGHSTTLNLKPYKGASQEQALSAIKDIFKKPDK